MLIDLSCGKLDNEQLNALLRTLPLELTFIDANNTIVFYNEREQPIFTRTPDMLGTDVYDCHSTASYPTIDRMLDDFRTGKRDTACTWRTVDGKKLLISYYAVRNKEGDYQGCLETVQEITALAALSDEGQDY